MTYPSDTPTPAHGEPPRPEPEHPTYGTLDQFLREIGATIRRGELLRIGHEGAIHWFIREYAERRKEDPDAD